MADHGLADPPTAARLGRLAGGRPGLALAYARAPDAVLIRAELTRVLLDMTDAGPADPAGGRASGHPARDRPVDGAVGGDDRRRAGPQPAAVAPGRRPARRRPPSSRPRSSDAAEADDPATEPDDTTATPARTPATERRRGVEVLLGLWTDVARDLVLIGAGGGPVGPRHRPARRAGGHRRGHRPGRRRGIPRPGRPVGRMARHQCLARAHPRHPRPRLAAPGRRGVSPRCHRRPPASRLDATVIGRVQGVGFRYFVLREAMALGLERLGREHVRRRGPVRRRGSASIARDPPRAAPRRSRLGHRRPGQRGVDAGHRHARAVRGPKRRTSGRLTTDHRPSGTGREDYSVRARASAILTHDGAELCGRGTSLSCIAPSSTAWPRSPRAVGAPSPTTSGPRPSASTREPGTSVRGVSSRRSSAATRPSSRHSRPAAVRAVVRSAPPDRPGRRSATQDESLDAVPPRRRRLVGCQMRRSAT